MIQNHYKLLSLFVFILAFSNVEQLPAQTFEINEVPYTLKGAWQVCVQETIDVQLECKEQSVPSNIEDAFENFDGYIFFRTQFSINQSLSDQALGIYIKSIRDSDEFYLNGTLIGKTGQLPPNFEKGTLYPRYYYLPSHLVKKNNINTIDIKVFNHARHGGIVTSAPVIDYAENISLHSLNQNSFLMISIGVFLLITFIQFFYYFAQPTSKVHLYFALLCIAEAVYLATYSSYALHSDINNNYFFRINIFMYASLTVIFCFFITTFFKHKRPLFINLALIVTVVTGLIQLLILPLNFQYHQVVLLNLLGVLVFIPFYIFLFYRSILEDMPNSKVMALIIFIHISMVIIDILIDLQVIPQFISGVAGLVSPFSLIALFITISLILTHRHWLYYRHATYDYLTDALRRSSFTERLSEEIPRSHRLKQPLMVAILDIDNFKQVNDQYSHLAGDQVLRELVQRIRYELREFDLLSRYGGDEFCIAALVTDTTDAMSLLKRVQLSVNAKPIVIKDKKEIAVTITIGAYVAEQDENHTPEELVAKADDILVKGKVKQKGKIHI